MKNLISFCRTGNDGKIMFTKGYGRFGEVPIADLQISPMDKKSIDDFLKRMDTTLYYLDEVVYLYFFYKVAENLLAVRYSNYLGSTEITEDIAVTENLTADDFGTICVYVPS